MSEAEANGVGGEQAAQQVLVVGAGRAARFPVLPGAFGQADLGQVRILDELVGGSDGLGDGPPHGQATALEEPVPAVLRDLPGDLGDERHRHGVGRARLAERAFTQGLPAGDVVHRSGLLDRLEPLGRPGEGGLPAQRERDAFAGGQGELGAGGEVGAVGLGGGVQPHSVGAGRRAGPLVVGFVDPGNDLAVVEPQAQRGGVEEAVTVPLTASTIRTRRARHCAGA